MGKLAWCLGGVLGAAMAAPAFAGQVVADYTGPAPTSTATVTLTAPNVPLVGTYYAGVLNFNNVDGSIWKGPFQAFCMEMYNLSGSQPHYYDVQEDLTKAPVGPTAFHLDNAQATALQQLWGGYRSSVVDNATAGAFQLAVWEIIYEKPGSSLDVTIGSFAADPTTADTVTANGWLQNLSGKPLAHLVALTNPEDQDMLTSVPLPAAAWLGMALMGGMGGIGAIRRRLQRA